MRPLRHLCNRECAATPRTRSSAFQWGPKALPALVAIQRDSTERGNNESHPYARYPRAFIFIRNPITFDEGKFATIPRGRVVRFDFFTVFEEIFTLLNIPKARIYIEFAQNYRYCMRHCTCNLKTENSRRTNRWWREHEFVKVH